MNTIDNSLEEVLLNSDALNRLSSNMGLDPNQAANVMQMVIPTLLGALSNNAQQPEGAAAIQRALQKDHNGSILDQLPELINNPAMGSGAGILKHVLGGNQGNLAQEISGKTGISPEAIQTIMSIAAPVIMGKLGQQQQQSGGNENTLTSLLNAASKSQQQKNPAASIALNLLSGYLNNQNGQANTQKKQANPNQEMINAGMNILGKLFGK